MRRHGIIALEPVTNHSLVSVAVKKAKTEKEGYGAVQIYMP